MALADKIVCAAILDVGPSASKAEVVERLLLELAAGGHLSAADVPALLEALLRREAVASTAIGSGVAIPHAKHAAVTRVIGALGLCRSPVNFDSIDGRPTDIIALLLAPPDRPGLPDRRASRDPGALMRRLADEGFRAKLRQSRCVQDITDLLQRYD